MLQCIIILKECDSLEIVTDSIKSFLEDTFDKDVKDILISELLSVEALTIDGKDLNGNKILVAFQDIKNFKNLRYLEIANTGINSSVINILSSMIYLESVVFRECYFSKKIKNIKKIAYINSLRVINCSDFDTFISELSGVKRFYLAGSEFNDLSCFNGYELESLDISSSVVHNFCGVENLCTNNLIISHSQYQQFSDKIDNLTFRVMIMADFHEGYYIEKWIC